ncbi:hypothetical protein [Paenibacillus sp. SI8]|uniref:hypothetical protein n=1 Tax=unclassified Paenibacillus TaxID=185978 RepID=UPI003465D78E
MVRIQFQTIHIDDISETSSVNHGTNRIIGRRHSAKSNQGLGDINGEHNTVIHGKHLVHDGDTFDMIKPKRKS